VITTEGRKKILADRKEADRLEKERRLVKAWPPCDTAPRGRLVGS
jgi:hypothetical protein